MIPDQGRGYVVVNGVSATVWTCGDNHICNGVEKVESIDSFYQVRALAAQQERFAQQLN
jgi:hypothetical protein